MVEVYFWPTPNGYKILLFLEETGLPHELKPVDITKGEQFDPAYLKISPNNKMPALVDREPADGGPPLPIFESGAILLYLAEKTGRLCPAAPRARLEALQWLFWQVGGLGPMAGQNHHFRNYAPETIPYAVDRYTAETARLYAVLNGRLADREFVAGEYSIADMACYPWIVPHEKQGQDLGEFPHLKRWFEAVAARPATIRAYERGQAVSSGGTLSEESKKILFGQGADRVR